jgi:hypothetical protein
MLLASLEGRTAINEIVHSSSFSSNAEASRLMRLGLTKKLISKGLTHQGPFTPQTPSDALVKQCLTL